MVLLRKALQSAKGAKGLHCRVLSSGSSARMLSSSATAVEVQHHVDTWEANLSGEVAVGSELSLPRPES